MTAAAAVSTVAFLDAAAQESGLCADFVYLIEQSSTGFPAIRGDTDSDLGGRDTTFALPGASHCTILEDAEKTSYRCTWKYPLGDKRALETFQRFVTEMRNCIGDMAEERTDRPVNHPDSYAAHYYRHRSGEASVSLKHKSRMMSTLVSIGIDGFKNAR